MDGRRPVADDLKLAGEKGAQGGNAQIGGNYTYNPRDCTYNTQGLRAEYLSLAEISPRIFSCISTSRAGKTENTALKC